MQEDLTLFLLTFTRQRPSRFQIIDGKLMPALATIDGLGDKAADAVVEAAANRTDSCQRMISVTGPRSARQ